MAVVVAAGEVAPYDAGMLDAGDGHQLYWETCGNPDGKPAVVLHGGPGSGCTPWYRRWFDPGLYRIVLFDQRNCGRSTPHAGESVVDLSTNTTQHLISDIERLRAHLGIDRWLVAGISWGTTLALAYAQEHPQCVSEMVLNSVVTTTRAEVEWLTRAMGRVFPEQWERFRDGVREQERDGDLAAAYSRLLHDPDPGVCHRAAASWCAWEDTHVATFLGHEPSPRYLDPSFRLCFARIVTHYFSHAGFLDDGALLANASRLTGIPGVLIQGRLDISGPPDIAWQLHRAWPDSQLVLLDTGHGATLDAVLEATQSLAGRG
jgi:proline iminopeptidase